MSVPVSKSSVPLVFDTLPAIGVRYGVGHIPRGILYTQARFYALGSCLSLGLTAFEREPAPESCVSFAIGGEGPSCLLAQLQPKPLGAAVYLCGKQGFAGPMPDKNEPAAGLHADYYAGVDEQGWYWGASLVLEQALLQQAGVRLAEGGQFHAALFKHTLGESGFAVSDTDASGVFPSFDDLPLYTVVNY